MSSTLADHVEAGKGGGEVTKICRLPWLTVYEPKCGGRGVVAGPHPNEYSCTQEPK
jgi:hypothetical protein